jgi:hypothetical protein
MFRFSDFESLGGMLYPWWFWTAAMGIARRRMRCPHPPDGNIKSNRITPHSLNAIPLLRGCRIKYRGFPRMLCCLTMNSAVARPAMNGSRPVHFRPLCL